MPSPWTAGRHCPSLFDRLADDAPDESLDPPGAPAISTEQWRQAVLRDLHGLLNTVRPVAQAPAGASVLGFGLPALAGRPVSGCDVHALARTLAQTLARFEPRLVATSVRVVPEARQDPVRHVLRYRIDALLRTRPLPSALTIRTEIDIDSGRARVEALR